MELGAEFAYPFYRLASLPETLGCSTQSRNVVATKPLEERCERMVTLSARPLESKSDPERSRPESRVLTALESITRRSASAASGYRPRSRRCFH